MPSSFIHIAKNGRVFFKLLNNIHIYIYISHIYTRTYIYISHQTVLICSPVDRYLDSSYTLTTVNNVAMNMGVQISLWDNDVISFEYIPRSGINGSHSSTLLNFLRNLPNGFPWELHKHTFPTTVHKSSVSSRFPPSLVISHLLVIAIQTGMGWYHLCLWFAFPW